MAPAFRDAFQLHQAGRLSEAEAAYRAILSATPEDVETILHLGLLIAQKGQLDEGARLLAEAVRRNPASPMAQFHLASVRAAIGRYEEALAGFSAAQALKPDLADAPFAKGNVLFGLGRLAEAAEAYQVALGIAPERIEILLNLGTALQEMHRLDEALSVCERALTLASNHPGALNNRGNTLRLLRRVEEALTDFDRAIAAAPNYALAHFNRATALKDLRRLEDALVACDTAITLAAQHAPAHHLRGTILLSLHRFDDALTSFETALGLQPNMIEAWYGRISALIELTRWEDALVACDSAIAREPNSVIAHNNRGVALLKLRRYDEAWKAFEQAIALEPQSAKGYFNRAGWYLQKDMPDKAFEDTQRAFEIEPDFVNAQVFRFCLAANLCNWQDRTKDIEAIKGFLRAGEVIDPFPLLYAADDPVLHLAAAGKVAGRSKQALTRTALMPRKRLRVAYLSADFREHPVSHQAAELFEAHDRSRVETFGISLWPQPDGPLSERMRKAFVHFVDAYDRSDYQIARRLAELQIDIAVELGGYSDKARPRVLAYRPAPVTVTYLGYPGTLGADYIDYLIADACTIPEGEDRFYAEKIVRLQECFMPYDSKNAATGSRPSRREEGLPENGFVFSNFNKTDKITPEIFDVWMRILNGVPGSVLWLSVPNATARGNLCAEARARHVEPDRLIFAERRAGRSEHLARLALADLFVDTLPYNAHATTSDFLAAGVPVLTCTGKTFASRVAASLLSAVGLPDLIVGNLVEYEKAAVQLAGDPQRLAALRSRIRRRTSADTQSLARHLEDAYFTMWDRRVRGLKPESFTIPA